VGQWPPAASATITNASHTSATRSCTGMSLGQEKTAFCIHELRRAFPEYAEMPIDEDIANRSENLDLAALPATVAPKWAARVREAMSDTQRRLRGATWYGESPSEPVVKSKKRKRGALQIISMWRVDWALSR